MPLSDDAWAMLRPRLIAQLDAAQRKQEEVSAANEALQASMDHQRDSTDTESIKERWEAFQTPIRQSLASYVDELVQTTWADGRAINRQTAAGFASDALVFARNRYAAEKPQNMQPGSAFRLVLNNMKWVYDNKIKPLTETAHGVRELFRCSGCGGESKMFAFDSLIQHYAAKHTDAFSNSTAGISWYEALWPERPPFRTRDQDPSPHVRHTDLAHPVPNSSVYGRLVQAYSDPYTLHQPIASSYRIPLTSPGFPPEAYGRFGAYSTPAPSHPSQATSPAFSETPGYLPPSASSPFGPHDPRYNPHSVHTPVQVAAPPGTWGASPGYPLTDQPYASSPARTQLSFLQIQMEAVATIAREMWDLLSPIKQIPPSVRIYVIVQHVVSKFKERFSNEPNVDLFSQCVVEHVLLRPMKDANGLACKVCVLEKESREEGHSHAFPLTGGERKLYSFATLLWHFKQVHIETKLALDNAQTHDDPEDLKRHDWKEDMIELPEESLLTGLKRLPGMRDHRRVAIFKEVFPTFFDDITPERTVAQWPSPASGRPHPLPAQGEMSPPAARPRADIDDSLALQGFIKIEPGDPYAGSYTFPAASNRADQYDPSRPSVSHAITRGAHNHFRGQVGSCHSGSDRTCTDQSSSVLMVRESAMDPIQKNAHGTGSDKPLLRVSPVICSRAYKPPKHSMGVQHSHIQ